jgi:hypothetical protein
MLFEPQLRPCLVYKEFLTYCPVVKTPTGTPIHSTMHNCFYILCWGLHAYFFYSGPKSRSPYKSEDNNLFLQHGTENNWPDLQT